MSIYQGDTKIAGAINFGNKANIDSPALTGIPTAPTAAVGTSTTQLATTAFVNAEIANDAAPKAHVGATGTAHGLATGSVNGFMSASDFTKLSGIATNANNYVHPTDDGNLHVPASGTGNAGKVLTASSTAGVYTWETAVAGSTTLADLGITATATEINYIDGVTSAVQTQLNGKAASSHTHTKSEITDFPTLAAVATSGSYNDLSNKPTIPTFPSIATQAQAEAGTDDTTMMTPLKTAEAIAASNSTSVVLAYW